MVLYFDAVYMGKDKYENEILIDHCCEYDIWFHVDHLSSAHVYLRDNDYKAAITEILKNHYAQYNSLNKLPFKAMEQAFKECSLSQQVLEECGQLVKGNSIKGSKEDAVDVIYTPCWNLKKTKGMETGSVLFMKNNLVKRIRIERDTQLLKKLTKLKVEGTSDAFQKYKLEYHKEIATLVDNDKQALKLKSKEEKTKKNDKEQAYRTMFDDSEYTTNKDGINEEDFM